jgi:hypothetical protein
MEDGAGGGSWSYCHIEVWLSESKLCTAEGRRVCV